MSEIETGKTYTVSFPRGMAKTDFAKCLKMAQKLGRRDGGSWTITVEGLHSAGVVAEMIDRGAQVTEA